MGITITSIDSSLNALIVKWDKDVTEPSGNTYAYKFVTDNNPASIRTVTESEFVIETQTPGKVSIVATSKAGNSVEYSFGTNSISPYLKGPPPIFSVFPVSDTAIEVRYADASYAGYPSLSKYKYTVTPITSNTKTLRQYNVGNGTRSLQNTVFWSALDDLPSIGAIAEPENNEVISQYSAGIEMFSGETMTGLISANFNTFSSRNSIEGEENINPEQKIIISGLSSNTVYDVTIQGVGTVDDTTAAWISDPATQTVTTNQIETTPPKIEMKSLFTDNSKIFYKPGSLSCGVGSTKNYRHKSKHT